MNLHYLHFNIFGLALTDMAADTGSISERLCNAFINHLYKIDWERDFEVVPADHKNDFLQLKKNLHDDLLKTIKKEKIKIHKRNAAFITLSEERLSDMSNAKTVIRKMHWTKAKKTTELMNRIYFGLGHSLSSSSRKG